MTCKQWYSCSQWSLWYDMATAAGLTVREGGSQPARRRGTFHANCGTRAHHWEMEAFIVSRECNGVSFQTLSHSSPGSCVDLAYQRCRERTGRARFCGLLQTLVLVPFFFFFIEATLRFIFQASACSSVTVLALRSHMAIKKLQSQLLINRKWRSDEWTTKCRLPSFFLSLKDQWFSCTKLCPSIIV